jgi:hypothetical protein
MNQRVTRYELILVLTFGLAVALVSARPYAGGWNDGSRLAQVECLVDYGTLAIDSSIFVNPARAKVSEATPYPPQDSDLLQGGTRDKVLINERFYSDKPPVPALLMGAWYQVLKWATGLQASSRPDLFVYSMTVFSSGLSFVIAVLCIHLLGRKMLSERSRAFAVTISFALGSSALAYARQVNSHVELLAVAAALMVCLQSLRRRLFKAPSPIGLMAGMGLLAGLAYCMDLAVGPLLLISVLCLVAYRCRPMGSKGFSMVGIFLFSALPLIALHHLLNYEIGGVLRPVNTVAEYLYWPGSPFNAGNATGHWSHSSLWHCLVYALELLFGKKGFLLHQPVLILALLGGIAVIFTDRPPVPELPEMLFSFAWSGAVWLVYAWGSNNSSGICATIRWFVPLLVPGYYVLLALLRYRPWHFPEFLVLGAGGMLLSIQMWRFGPWMRMVPGYWFILGITLLGWSMVVLHRRRRSPDRVRQ